MRPLTFRLMLMRFYSDSDDEPLFMLAVTNLYAYEDKFMDCTHVGKYLHTPTST